MNWLGDVSNVHVFQDMHVKILVLNSARDMHRSPVISALCCVLRLCLGTPPFTVSVKI
jgi:hypothetical protein